MRGFGALHLRRLREHPGRAALSVAGIAVGTALMVAMLGLFSSMTTSVEGLADLAGAADLEVAAPNDGGLPEALTAEVAAVTGVQAAVPIVRSVATVERTRALVIGLDARAVALGETAGPGCELPPLPARSGVVAGPGIARKRTVTVTSPGGTQEVEVLARLECGAASRFNNGEFVAAPLPLAQQLVGRPGRVDAIEIVAASGSDLGTLTDDVTRLVAGRAVVASPQLIVEQARESSRAFQQGASMIIGLALVVGGFCVFNTVSMTALERRRELATLRAVGGRRRRLLAGFLLEVAVLGVIGSAVGALLGALAGRQLVANVPAVLVDQLGVRPTYSLPPASVVLALMVGAAVTVAAAWVPARSAVRVAPVEAMRPEGALEGGDTEARGVVWMAALGLALFVAGTVLAVTGDSGVTLVGFSVITLGSLLATYGLRAAIARGAASVAAQFGAGGRLAAASIARAPRRTWATVAAVVIAVGTVVSMGGVMANQMSTVLVKFESLADPDVWVGTSPSDTIPVELRFPSSTVDQVATVAGVERVVASQAGYATIGGDRVLLEGFGGLSRAPAFAALDLADQTRLLDADRPVAFVTKAFADRQKVRAGGDVELLTPSGRQRLPVIAVVDLVSPSTTGLVGLSLPVLERFYGRTGATFLEVDLKPGVSRSEGKQRIAEALKDSPTPAFVSTGDEEFAGTEASIRSSTALFSAMQLAVLVATALAVGNTLLISVIERRREIGIVRAVGTSRRQLHRMVVVESLAVAAVGTAIGLVLGVIQHRVGVVAVEGLTGIRVDYSPVATPALLAVAAATVTALVAAVLPAIRAGRVNLIEAIGYE